MMDEQEMEDEEADVYREEPQTLMNDDGEENAQGLLAAAGLEDSDADEETVIYYLIGIMTFENIFCFPHTIFFGSNLILSILLHIG